MVVITSNCTWFSVFVLSCILIVRSAGNTLRITDKRMTWFESFNECNLADPAAASGIIGHRYRAWTGALYLNTPWMVHAGCYKHSSGYAVVSYASHSNSPSECSYQCRTYQYFMLKGIWCNCGDSIKMLLEAKRVDCSEKCPGVNTSCGSMKNTFIDVYRHISGNDAPTGHQDQELRCSVFKRQDTTITLSAVHCSSRYHSLCLQTDRNATAITVLPNYAQFEIAREQCNLIQNEAINKESISKLVTGKAYWTGIHRTSVLHSIQQESGNDICNKMATKPYVKCIMVDRKAKNWVLYIPLPCTDSFPAICRGNKLTPTDKIQNDCNIDVLNIDKDANRISQTTVDRKLPPTTTELQKIINWSTKIALHMPSTDSHADKSSAAISDNIVSQFTTELETFTVWLTNVSYSPTSTEKLNYTVLVKNIKTGGIPAYFVAHLIAILITLFVGLYCCDKRNLQTIYHARNNLNVSCTDPQMEYHVYHEIDDTQVVINLHRSPSGNTIPCDTGNIAVLHDSRYLPLAENWQFRSPTYATANPDSSYPVIASNVEAVENMS